MQPESRLPPSFTRAVWRGQTPVDVATGRVGVSFHTDAGERVRLAIQPKDIDTMAAVLADYRSKIGSQSPMSSESLNRDGSPQDGMIWKDIACSA